MSDLRRLLLLTIIFTICHLLTLTTTCHYSLRHSLYYQLGFCTAKTIVEAKVQPVAGTPVAPCTTPPDVALVVTVSLRPQQDTLLALLHSVARAFEFVVNSVAKDGSGRTVGGSVCLVVVSQDGLLWPDGDAVPPSVLPVSPPSISTHTHRPPRHLPQRNLLDHPVFGERTDHAHVAPSVSALYGEYLVVPERPPWRRQALESASPVTLCYNASACLAAQGRRVVLAVPRNESRLLWAVDATHGRLRSLGTFAACLAALPGPTSHHLSASLSPACSSLILLRSPRAVMGNGCHSFGSELFVWSPRYQACLGPDGAFHSPCTDGHLLTVAGSDFIVQPRRVSPCNSQEMKWTAAQALRHALTLQPRYIFLLQDDTILAPSCLAALPDAIAAAHDVQAAAGRPTDWWLLKLFYPDNWEQWTAFANLHELLLPLGAALWLARVYGGSSRSLWYGGLLIATSVLFALNRVHVLPKPSPAVIRKPSGSMAQALVMPANPEKVRRLALKLELAAASDRLDRRYDQLLDEEFDTDVLRRVPSLVQHTGIFSTFDGKQSGLGFQPNLWKIKTDEAWEGSNT